MNVSYYKNPLLRFLFIATTVVILILINLKHFLLYHFVVELAGALIGYIILIIVVNTKEYSENKTYTFLAISYTFIGSIDLLHALISNGMNLFNNVTSGNPAAQLWIIARIVESISLVIAFMFIKKINNYNKVVFAYFLVLIYSSLVILKENLFPICYIEGLGPTRFKIISEYLMCITLFFIMHFLYINREKYGFIKNEYKYIMISMSCKIISELFLTLYGNCNLNIIVIGHIFKLISIYYIYVALVKRCLKNPYDTIFENLNENLEKLQEANDCLFLKNNELREMKYTLERNLKVYKEFLEVFPLAVIIRKKEKIVYINNKTKQLLKLNRKRDIIGKSLLDILEDSYKDIVKERIRMESKEKIGPPLEEKFICADGSIVDVEVTVTSIYFDNKEYFMGVLKDITHIKKLKEVEKELEEKIERDNIRSEFFANISHELRTPINVIYSALQLEEIYFNNEDYKKIRENSKVIKQNCMRLLRMVNNIIDITKIDSGFFKPAIKCVNIVDVVENVVMSVADYIESRRMNIIFDTESEEEYVSCDPDLIERIILNLISNCIKYGKTGGHIYINICNDYKGAVSISVKDDGIGIPKSKSNSIFGRFMRVDNSLTRNCEGSGIGLSLVESLVKIQGGTIDLNSEENLGTEIIIRFPTVEIASEVCATISSDRCDTSNIIEKVDLEFSDIYDV